MYRHGKMGENGQISRSQKLQITTFINGHLRSAFPIVPGNNQRRHDNRSRFVNKSGWHDRLIEKTIAAFSKQSLLRGLTLAVCY